MLPMDLVMCQHSLSYSKKEVRLWLFILMEMKRLLVKSINYEGMDESRWLQKLITRRVLPLICG